MKLISVQECRHFNYQLRHIGNGQSAAHNRMEQWKGKCFLNVAPKDINSVYILIKRLMYVTV